MSIDRPTAPHVPPLEAPGPPQGGHAPGYRAGRTLSLRVEALRQLRRRRTLVIAGVLAALPVVMAVALAVGDSDGRRGSGSNGSLLMQLATGSAVNFTVTVLFVSAGFLLVIPVALFCGDTVASEASWSSLRYLLAAPVPRGRLLRSKLTVGLAFSLASYLLLAAASLLVGGLAYGWGGLQLPAGGSLPFGEAVQRLGVMVLFVYLTQLVTAALAFWLSTVTDAPLGAVGGAVGLTVVGNVLDAVEALGSWRDLLPTHWQYAWIDALQQEVVWDGMVKGVAVSASYALVLFALAFRGFRAKDVVS